MVKRSVKNTRRKGRRIESKIELANGKMIDMATLIWFAGFFDGEGSLGVHEWRVDKRDREYIVWRMRVVQAVGNNGKEICEEIRRKVGGSVYFVSKEKQRQKGKKTQDQYCWYLHRQGEIRELLKHLLPFLRVKRKICEKCLVDLQKKYRKKYGHHWSKKEIDFVKRIRHKRSAREIGKLLGRTKGAVDHITQELKLTSTQYSYNEH